ncbi:MAG: SusD/RagB family nutrient-binding outer membrane lipoprotein [Saprospiraceae bacterium]|nr:SusD/RagB family nutrient-binding outer membrane lipoprotein [Saprospiraceae bacterium]MBK7812359.1 SusD/RagB family nutrient-binding outer membrane lipoprotein [Saprospiraceae bacterium]
MKKILVLFIFILLTGTSCSDWLDINTDPNNPTEVPADLILPNAQMQIAGAVGGDYAILGGIWSQHWTQSHIASQYKDIDSYDLTDKDFEIDWSELYSDALVDLAEIKSKSSAAGEWNSFLQATCLEAYTFQILADLYDKIPLKEALQGSANLTPKFDNGKEVYDELFARIDAALGKDFNSSNVVKVTSDLLFGTQDKAAQIDSWKRFANTLKLKLLLRQTESANGAAATQKISDLLAAGTEFLTGHAAISIFIDEANRSNPLYENNVRQLNVATNLRASYTLLSLLQANNDPRLDAYFVPGSTGHFALAQGDFNELTSVTPGARTSSAKFSATTPFYFFSADEVSFMLAEAILRTGGNAESNYYDGVRSAFSKFGLTAPQNLLDNVYKFPSSGSVEEKLEAIITQKWLASVNQGYESFFDQNRTGFPRISNVAADDPAYVPGRYTYSIEGVTSGRFPKRLIFPDLSRRVNPNTPAFVAITEKVWWVK